MDTGGTWALRRFEESLSSEWFKNLVLAQDVVSCVTHRFFRERGLVTMNLPVTTGAVSSPMAVGSDSLPVLARIGDCDTYLADSMQFFLEYGCRIHQHGCFYLMPSFRGEEVDETHLAQFYHCEAEIPGRLNDIIQLVESFVRELGRKLVAVLAGRPGVPDLDHVVRLCDSRGGFAQVSHGQAVQHLEHQAGALRRTTTGSFVVTRQGELALIASAGGPVWLTYPPADTVPFYQAKCDWNPRLAACADLLLGVGEVVGAGERHADQKGVETALREQGVSRDGYGWYIRMKELTPIQTCGFGLGVERFLCWALRDHDIRNFELIPRRNTEILDP